MFKNIMKIFKGIRKKHKENSKNAAKERLHLVLAQDRANISADFLELMKQEIIEIIKKYIDIDEKAIDVRMTNKTSENGTIGAPALYANIPIVTIKEEARKFETSKNNEEKEKSKKAQKNKEKAKEKEPETKNENKDSETDETQKQDNENSKDKKENEAKEKLNSENVKEDKDEKENS